MKMFIKFLRKSVSFSNYFSCGVMFLVFFFLAAFLSGLKHLGWAGLGRGCHRPWHVITGHPPPQHLPSTSYLSPSRHLVKMSPEAEGTRLRGRARWASRPWPRSATVL